jgi:hypothetical protein
MRKNRDHDRKLAMKDDIKKGKGGALELEYMEKK